MDDALPDGPAPSDRSPSPDADSTSPAPSAPASSESASAPEGAPALLLGAVKSLHPMGGARSLVALDLPLRHLRVPVGTGSRIAFRRAGLDDLVTTVRAIGQPGRGATDPVLVVAVDADVAARIEAGDAAWLCA